MILKSLFSKINIIQISERLVGNVPIRIYKPVTVINEASNPAVIFYHGGAFIFDKIGKQIYALL